MLSDADYAIALIGTGDPRIGPSTADVLRESRDVSVVASVSPGFIR